MSSRQELADRRERLVARSETQRAQLSQSYAGLSRGLKFLDQGYLAAKYIGDHPPLLLGVVGAATAFQHKRIVRWLSKGWPTWLMALTMKPDLSGIKAAALSAIVAAVSRKLNTRQSS